MFSPKISPYNKTNSQGFPAPGTGPQSTGPARPLGRSEADLNDPVRPTQGFRSWLKPGSGPGGARGFPSPLNKRQTRPAGSMPQHPIAYGLPIQVWTPYYDRGAAAYVQNFGKVLTNPIGAGIAALYRPRASYGPAAQYARDALWWTSQVIPTSIHVQGLNSPEELEAILGSLQVQAVVRTTG